MRIALIHSHLNDRGGSQRYVIEIANTLKKLGIEIDIFCYEYNQKSCYPELTQNLDIYKLYTRENDATLNDNIPNKNGLLKTALKLLYKNSIVKNIVNTLGIDYLFSIYSTKKNARRLSNLIKSKNQNYDLIFAHEEPLSIWSAIEYKKDMNIPIYWFCYDTIEKWFLEWKDLHKKSNIRRFLLKNFYFKYDKYLVNKYVNSMAVLDNNMLKRVERMYNRTPLIRRGGIPEEVLQYKRDNFFRKKYKLSKDTIVIFSLTRFVNYRRVHDIFEMYLKLPQNIKNKIFIYINAPITDEIYYQECSMKYNNIINSKNLKVDLSFPVNDKEMYSMYLSSDIFIFPNENQTWGHAPLEAMGCGTTAIVSTGCGIHEVIKSITPNTVYEVSNIELLTEKVINLLENDNYTATSSLQKNYVLNNLTWTKICEQYIDDFNKIL